MYPYGKCRDDGAGQPALIGSAIATSIASSPYVPTYIKWPLSRPYIDSVGTVRPPGRDSATKRRPTYDDSEWPIFVARMPPDRLTAAGFETHLQALRQPFRRGEPFAVLIVMGNHPPLSPTERKAAADAMKADNERYPGRLRAKAIVIRSGVERGIVTAVAWMAKPPYPFAAFEDEVLAKAWLRAQLDI